MNSSNVIKSEYKLNMSDASHMKHQLFIDDPLYIFEIQMNWNEN